MMINKSRMRVLAGAVLLVLALVLVSMTIDVEAADANWTARYWNNKTLAGDPTLTRSESSVDYDWADNAPAAGVNKDLFSARWTKVINFPASDTYRFNITMDDGMRLYVDGILIIDSWWDSQVHSLSSDRYMNAGDHEVRIEYYDAGGKAVARFSYFQLGSPVPQTFAGWRAEYFNNMSLFGNPVLVRDESKLDYDWGTGAPGAGVPADGFSARWTRTFYMDGGRYQFVATADDGVRLWVNGVLLVDQWHDAGVMSYMAEIDLPAGNIPVRIEYFENQGGAIARFGYQRLSGGSAMGWYGEYFNNRDLSGSPTMVRNDGQINFDWKNLAPGGNVGSDNFSVRWTRSMSFSAGRYRFSLTSDDGARAWVNGQLILNNWSDHKPQTVIVDIDLPSGYLPMQVEYYEHTGDAQVSFSWSLVYTTPAPTPVPTPTTGAVGTVVGDLLNVRIGPGLQYQILGQLVKGQIIGLRGYRTADDHWVMVTYNGSDAWVSALTWLLSTNVNLNTLTIYTGSLPATGGGTSPSGEPTAIVGNAYYLNVRTGPGISNPVLTIAPSGTQLVMLARNSTTGWIKIRMASGQIGWVSASYLVSPSVAFNTLPVATN